MSSNTSQNQPENSIGIGIYNCNYFIFYMSNIYPDKYSHSLEYNVDKIERKL